jgi:large conductance mechanosensitive channel
MTEKKGFVQEFKDFIARGNVIDLAVGVIIGASFTKIVTSLVEGILMPPIGLLIGPIDFASKFVVLDASKGVPASLTDAKTKGIPVLAYGQFINDVITFLLVAPVIFIIVKRVNRLWSAQHPESEGPTTKNCPFCVSAIPFKATRCPHCTSELLEAGG